MFDGDLRKITRPHFIIEPLQPRRLLSLTVAADVVSGEESCVISAEELIDFLPGGEFAVSESLQEPVSEESGEVAAGEEVMYTMLEYTTLETTMELEGSVMEGGEEIYYTMLENDVVEAYPYEGEVPEEWLYTTMEPVDEFSEEPLENLEDGEVILYFGTDGDPNEILQTGVGPIAETPAVIAPPPAQAAVFARPKARPALSASVLSLGDRDLLASPERVLV